MSDTEKPLQNKSIAMVIAFRDFKDAEYFIPKEILEIAGANIITVSNAGGGAIGSDGGEVKVDLEVNEVEIGNFDALLFIGGSGMAKMLDSTNFQELAKHAAKNDKVLGAICIAPALLAKAGILDGRKATVWSGPLDKSAIKTLEQKGAVYENKPVVVDGNIVTAKGPDAAQEFAKALINLLK